MPSKPKPCQHLMTLTFLPQSQVIVTPTRIIQGCPTDPGTPTLSHCHHSVHNPQPHPRHSLSPTAPNLLLYPHYMGSLGLSKFLYNPVFQLFLVFNFYPQNTSSVNYSNLSVQPIARHDFYLYDSTHNPHT